MDKEMLAGRDGNARSDRTVERSKQMIGLLRSSPVGSALRLACVAVLTLLVGCSGVNDGGGPSAGDAWVTQERLLVAEFPVDEPLEGIEGTSTWRRGGVEIAAQFPKEVTPSYGAAYGRHRWSLYAHAPSTISFPPIQVGRDAVFHFGWFLPEKAFERGSDGATFRVWCATEASSRGVCVFEGHTDGESPGVRREEVPLPVASGEHVRLMLETDPGERGLESAQADYCYWEMPALRWQRRVKPRRNKGPNVVLFTLDTLRADRLHCYGYDRNTSPNINALAAQGTLLTQAYSQSTTTIPSHISIMTSKYLNEFGIYTQTEDPLHPSFQTMAECLRDHGYTTAGFLAAGFMRDDWSGLGQGFETFIECPVGTLDGEYVVNEFNDWLVESHEKPFFAWIHLYDCHVPYDAPEPHGGRFVDPDAPYPPHLDTSLFVARDDRPFERRNREYYSDRYDGGVAYADHQVGRVVSALEDLGLRENTLIVIAADHGECLGEHSIYFDHVSLYEPNVHVPLIFSWPDRVPCGERVNELCENVDIYPTILELLDLEIPEDLSGESLVDVWDGVVAGRDGVITEHSLHAAVSWRTKEWSYLYQPVAAEPHRSAMLDMWNSGPPRQWLMHAEGEELYNRQDDPDEEDNLSSTEKQTLQRMRNECAEWINACNEAWMDGTPWENKPRVHPARVKELSDLGYVGR